MIIELRTLLPVREEEESPQSSGKNSPGEKHEETPLVDVEIRSAAPPRTPSQVFPEELSYSTSFPGSPLIPENPPFSASEGAGITGDGRILELLERLIAAAERSAVFAEQIADSLERQSAVSVPAYA